MRPYQAPTVGEMECLSPQKMVNGEVIGAYLWLVEQSSHGSGNSTVLAMDTYFYPGLRRWGYKEVARLCQHLELKGVKYFMVPIHEVLPTNHWFLLVADLEKGEITVIDSIPGRDHSQSLTELTQFLHAWCDTMFPGRIWRLWEDCTSPQQCGSWDCGICEAAAALAQGPISSFSHPLTGLKNVEKPSDSNMT
ncbi:hypothetical protein LSTR_LSTR004141 [Laodelphax striatellus]|uniref:Ubiquitin-like protease family profile domain-containing protein n=1 Tax=Laodelphax striatellus TaxID=195883 RepID=A0A482X9A8_LAOST|nr:hypothetical protein LSTR_LSTR004141 [Laodelphax striatellus]